MNVTPLAVAAAGLGPVPLPEYAVRAAARRAATAAAASTAEVMLSETAITADAAAAKCNFTVASDFIVDESVLFTDGELSAYADVNVDELMGEGEREREREKKNFKTMFLKSEKLFLTQLVSLQLSPCRPTPLPWLSLKPTRLRPR